MRMLWPSLFAFYASWCRQVSVDVEGDIYSLAARSGITLFTVSHRKSLWKHHSVSVVAGTSFPLFSRGFGNDAF